MEEVLFCFCIWALKSRLAALSKAEELEPTEESGRNPSEQVFLNSEKEAVLMVCYVHKTK